MPNFYPRPPRGGRRLDIPLVAQVFVISIHALREEGDAAPGYRKPRLRNFYPRPPRGGRPIWVLSRLVSREISIHALREEGDLCSRNRQHGVDISIHALREEGDTCGGCFRHLDLLISIHALREEGDHGAFSYLRSPL